MLHSSVYISLKIFIDHLKEHRQQFELMLEGENHVDNCKQKLSMAESRESKIRKEYKKALKRAENHGGPELNEIEGQLKQATHARDLAQEECIKLRESSLHLNQF